MNRIDLDQAFWNYISGNISGKTKGYSTQAFYRKGDKLRAMKKANL